MKQADKFQPKCGHGRKINRVRVFGFTDYQHADDGTSCDKCNKFSTKTAAIAGLLAEGAPRSIADDAYRAFLLVSPTKRKEYLKWVADLPLDEFLYEIRLLDRFVILRHGYNQCLYKLGTEAFKEFGGQLSNAIEFLFPNTYYERNEITKKNIRKSRYYRCLPYTYAPIKIAVSCNEELIKLCDEQDKQMQNLGQTNVNMPSAESGPGVIRFATGIPIANSVAESNQ